MRSPGARKTGRNRRDQDVRRDTRRGCRTLADPWTRSVLCRAEQGLDDRAALAGVAAVDTAARDGGLQQLQALLWAELHAVALDVVQPHGPQQSGVLDGEIARGVTRVQVEVLVPGPSRRGEQSALGPLDHLDRLVVVVDERVAVALDDVEVGLGCVPVA